MDETTGLIAAGTQLAIVGMGTVFVFLTVLVGATSVMSWLVGQFPQAADDTPASSGSPDQHELVAVITAAIHAHRRRK